MLKPAAEIFLEHNRCGNFIHQRFIPPFHLWQPHLQHGIFGHLGCIPLIHFLDWHIGKILLQAFYASFNQRGGMRGTVIPVLGLTDYNQLHRFPCKIILEEWNQLF